MARPKSNKSSVEVVKEALELDADESRKARIAIAKEIQDKKDLMSSPEDRTDYRPHFRIWWAANRESYKRPKELEEVLWIHLKAIKCANPDMFEMGIKHFGFRKQ